MIANRTTTNARGREAYIRDVLASLSVEDLEALEALCKLENRGSRIWGGHTWEQAEETARAWMALSPAAQRAYHSVVCFTVNELVEAIQDVGIPEDTGRDVEAVWALLGPDHPAYSVLPDYALVNAYKEAINLIDK